MALVFIAIVVSGMVGFVLGALAVGESYKYHKDKENLEMTDLEYIKNDDLAELEKAIEHCSSLSMQNETYYKQTMEQGDVVGMQYFANLYGEYNQIYQWLTELKRLRATDVQPVKRGEWITSHPVDIAKEFKCTNCGGLVLLPVFAKRCYYDYCPNCGAYMKNDD